MTRSGIESALSGDGPFDQLGIQDAGNGIDTSATFEANPGVP